MLLCIFMEIEMSLDHMSAYHHVLEFRGSLMLWSKAIMLVWS